MRHLRLPRIDKLGRQVVARHDDILRVGIVYKLVLAVFGRDPTDGYAGDTGIGSLGVELGYCLSALPRDRRQMPTCEVGLDDGDICELIRAWDTYAAEEKSL